MRPDPPPPPKRRLETHSQMWELHCQGWPGEEVARHFGISRTTTHRHLKSKMFPERKGRSDAGRNSIEAWGSWVIERWKGSREQWNVKTM